MPCENWRRRTACSALLWAVALGGGVAAAQPVGRAGQALTAGASPVSAGEIGQLGLVSTVTFAQGQPSGVGCSGILLTNVVVLTAGHCLDALTGKTTQVSVPGVAGVFTMNALYKFGVGSQDLTGPDIGMIQLSAPLPEGGLTNRFFTRLNRTDPTGKAVTIYGESTGVYLKALTTVQAAAGPLNHNLQLAPGPLGSTTAQGDSGGPTLLTEGGQTSLVGVTSATGGLIAAIHPHVGWITAALQSFLDQTQPFAAGTTLAEEIAALPEGAQAVVPGHPIDGAWQPLQRIAMLMCTKRGFIGGTLIPDMSRQSGQYRFACIGRSGGTIVSASQAQLDATGAGFTDLSTLGWAQGARAASGLCAAVTQSVGGFLTGSAAPGAAATAVCLNSAAGSFIDVDPAFLTRIGASDLNKVAWLYGRADAADFCRAIGYTGGFANGNQVPGKRGLVCIGQAPVAQGGFDLSGPPALLARNRALYAINLDEPLEAPAASPVDATPGFAPCHAMVVVSGTCRLVPAYEQWNYEAATHHLRHAPSGKCVNLSGLTATQAAGIIVSACGGGAAEGWSLLPPAGSGRWRIRSDLSHLCLTALPGRFAGASGSGRVTDRIVTARAPRLAMRPCDGSDGQGFDDADAGFYKATAPR